MPEERTVGKVFKNTSEGKRSVEKSKERERERERWLDGVENDLKKMGVKRLEKNS
jgi:hypothetical protein